MNKQQPDLRTPEKPTATVRALLFGATLRQLTSE